MHSQLTSTLRRIEDVERERFVADGACVFNREDEGEPYFVLMPPPNVTGPLHVGHGISLVIQDTLVRHRRMQGYNVYFPPGLDHAGCRLEHAVRQRLLRDGRDADARDRQALLGHLHAWVAEHGAGILREMKTLSIAAHWDHAWFSMDDARSRVVQDMFVDLYERGLVYREPAVTNWCPELGMAIPGDGLEIVEEQGTVYRLRLEHPSGAIELEVRRPEFLLGASAVAVTREHPAFQRLLGTEVRLPITGQSVPVVEIAPRTGLDAGVLAPLVPSASGMDFECARACKLPVPELYAEDGHIAAGPHPFGGLPIDECRRRIVAALEAGGYVATAIPAPLQRVFPLGFGPLLVVPRVTEQWYLSVQKLSEEALARVPDTPVRFNARIWQRGYRYWLRRYQSGDQRTHNLWWDGADLTTTRGFSNNRDWILSSQAAWGQRLPIWYCDECGRPSISRTELEACSWCRSSKIRAGDDVVQLIFSCAMWPKSVGIWPERAAMTDLTVTGHDVYLYWIATSNMVFGEIEGKLAYANVHVHGLITDEHGVKMTKSNGNTVALSDILADEGVEVTRSYFYHALAGREGEPWLQLGPSLLEQARASVQALLTSLTELPVRNDGAPDPAEMAKLDELRTVVDADLEQGHVGVAYRRVLQHHRQLDADAGSGREALEGFLALLHRFHPLLSDHVFRTRLQGAKTLLLHARNGHARPPA